MQTITAVLAGQPNVGKSMLINAISNSKLKVGNFSGVTVDKTEVEFKYCDDKSCTDHEIHIIDLPGAYSLANYTIEERVTKNFLENEKYDLIINVVDSTNLERNLLLTAELLELGKKMIVVLNMSDEAKKEGIEIDEKQLSKILGVPVVKTSAKEEEGIHELQEAIVEVYNKPFTDGKIVYSDVIEEEIANIQELFIEKKYICEIPPRHVAIRLLQEDKKIYKKLHDEPIWIELEPILRKALEHIYIHHNTKDLHEIFDDERIAFAKGVAMEVTTFKEQKSLTLTQKIDNILINKYFGIPIFLFFMWGLFQLTFEFGSIPMDYIDTFFSKLGEGAKTIFGDGVLGELIADGAIAGVGAVVMFLPNIIILFLGIALLETTGYMSRVAFLLDGFFHKFGLHGKSFIPLVTGFGCSVPAYMAARTLKNEKDRLLTLFIIGFMSCGARLPIYVLFTAAFFPSEKAGNMLFLIYITGAILGLIAAKVLNILVFKGEDEPFVMEMPKYRLPSLKLIYHTVYSQAKSYLKKAGTFILAASMLVWFASNYPKGSDLEDSYLGQIGKATAPFFEPLGFDWKMSVALEAGLAAKEVVVSTLGVLYAVGEVDENDKSLQKQIKKQIPFPSAVAFIVFVMIYLPCFAASAVFAKEAGGWKYLVYLFIFTTATAWGLSFVAYHIAKGVIGA
jgi:ferrous iron transport protein B